MEFGLTGAAAGRKARHAGDAQRYAVRKAAIPVAYRRPGRGPLHFLDMANDLRAALLCLAALITAVVGGGCTADDERSSRTDSGAVQTLPEDEALAAPPVEPTPTDLDEALAAPPVEAKRSGMGEAAFWGLIAEAGQGAAEDTDERSHRLQELLTQLPPQAIVDFERTRRSFDLRAYTWELWGAAHVVEDGCSDDCFRDFRAYLISLGREPYEAGLRDPDSLADVVQDAETGDWENADSVAGEAYSSVTGEDFPFDDNDLSGPPGGTPWDSEDEDALAQRYPRLAARFR